MSLDALGDDGKPVDWWFIYKVAGKSTTSSGAKRPTIHGSPVRGVEYVYADAKSPTLRLSGRTVDRAGALESTLAQVYGAQREGVGWFCYNDENPTDGKVNSSRGHTKGVLAFDLASDTGFWLIQSTPKFPPKKTYVFPKTGMPNAQSLLCITLQNASVAESIARQMFVAQQPNVYLASAIPRGLAGAHNDPRVKLMGDKVANGNTPVHVVVPFKSRGGVKFMSIAKNKTWGLDFYNDLVGPTLNENLDVETWEHDPTPRSQDNDKVHTVVDMKEVDLGHLDVDVAWSEEADHAKVAISAPSEKVRYVCVGDINYTVAQRKRGGGTVAFQCDELWSGLAAVLERTPDFARVTGGKAPRASGASGGAKRAPKKEPPTRKSSSRSAAKEHSPYRTTKHGAKETRSGRARP